MLKINHLYKTYNPGLVNEQVLFKDFSLHIKKGEFVSVVGSNGSGKSSLMNLICGSVPVDAGVMKLNDIDITHMNEFKRAAFIGRVFQDPSIGTCPSMTILENMSMADNKGKKFNLTPGVNKRKTDTYKELLITLKLGLQDKINLPVGSLSGGQRQALALLMCTMTPIDFLILDEHTAALDPNISQTIMELTGQIVNKNKITTLMVTHNLKYAIGYGNRILMMHKGEVILDKSGDEKENVDVNHLLSMFNEISIELGN